MRLLRLSRVTWISQRGRETLAEVLFKSPLILASRSKMTDSQAYRKKQSGAVNQPLNLESDPNFNSHYTTYSLVR